MYLKIRRTKLFIGFCWINLSDGYRCVEDGAKKKK
jgi:hypothetical protein